MNAIGGTYDNSTALLHENQRRAARRHVVKLDEDGNPIAQEDDQEAQEDDDGFSIRTESVKDAEMSKEVFVTQADDAVLHPPTEEESQAAVAAAGSALEEALAEAGMGEEGGNGTASGGVGEAGGSEGSAAGVAPATATETATASASATATAAEAAAAGTTPATEGGVAAGEGGVGPSDGSGEGKEGVDELEAEAAVVLEAEGEGGAIGDAEAAAAAATAAAAAEEEALAAAEAAAEEAAAAAAAAEAAATARAAANAALAEENRQFLLATLRATMAAKAEAEAENARLHLHLATWCTANVKTSAAATSLLAAGGSGGPPPTSASGPKRVPVTSLDTPLARQLAAREEAAARLKNEELRGAFTKERGRKERELAHYDGKAAALQATLEAREGHLNAVTKAFRAYKREVCATAAHSVTGKRLPPGLVGGYEAREAEVDGHVAKAELKHTSMVYALRAARVGPPWMPPPRLPPLQSRSSCAWRT